jgi:hypothetical protein
MPKTKIHVIHENTTWVEPLRAAFAEIGAPFEEWFISDGLLDLSTEPPGGIYYNRMSASSHTRNHRYAAELTGGVLAWLEAHGRRVVNNGRALQLEISKIAQYTALADFAIRTPRTIAAVGADDILAAAHRMSGRSLRSTTVRAKVLVFGCFKTSTHCANISRPRFEPSVDGITLIQEYIQAPEPFITRVEFVGGKFLYAVRVDTSLGFELCPADVCQVGDAFCPADAPAAAPTFRILKGFSHPLVERYQRFLAANGIGIAGIEFIADREGEIYTYDVNTNTNYNAAAEAEAGIYGMRAIASYLGASAAARATSRFGATA